MGFAAGLSAGQALAVQQLNTGFMQFQQNAVASLLPMMGQCEGDEQARVANLAQSFMTSMAQMQAVTVDMTAAASSAAVGSKK